MPFEVDQSANEPVAGEEGPQHWSVAIFAARESLVDLQRTLSSAVVAARAHTVIDLLVNGNSALARDAEAMLKSMSRSDDLSSTSIRLWYINVGDKAHAWNQYLQIIWSRSDVAFFVDGYARVAPTAFVLLADSLMRSEGHLAGTGVPTVGRTARSQRESMLRYGGIHGNLFALKGTTMERLRGIGFRLPLGLYRTDSTIGAVLSFNLDPLSWHWNPKERIFVHPEVTWAIDQKSVLSLSDLSTFWNRRIRQGQGILENLAIRDFLAVQKRSPADLPNTAASLVAEWVNRNSWQALRAFLRHPVTVGLATRRLRAPRDWSGVATAPMERITVRASTVERRV